MNHGVDTSVGLDEGRHGFLGLLRNSKAFLKGEERPTLCIFVAGDTCHNIISIDCHLLASHLFPFVSLFR